MKGLSNATTLTISISKRLLMLACDASEGDAPQNINHCKSPNPYQSLYGEEWEKTIKDTAHMQKCVSMEYEQDFFFYHDALSLITSSETVNLMQQEGILKYWILPEQGLNSGT
eukprot:8060696-Ditylum_brightwellii.AAC.1